jgi:hypothetical protein
MILEASAKNNLFQIYTLVIKIIYIVVEINITHLHSLLFQNIEAGKPNKKYRRETQI